MSRVRIGTCSGPADAAIVRSMFAAHGISAVIGAEHHAGMLGGLGGAFLSLDIWVDSEEREEAIALLAELRDHAPSKGDGDEDEPDDDDDQDDDAPSEAGARASASSLHLRIDRRRKTAIVLLLGCVVTFGTAHMFTRAWLRGMMLAGVETVGLLHIWNGRELGTLVMLSAIVADVAGALWRVRTAPRTNLPEARLRR